MRYSIIMVIIALGAWSCIPDGAKRQLDDQMMELQKMMADSGFKKAIANIELHKTRYGSYPNSLADLRFVPMLDSGFFQGIEYAKLDSGYELNINLEAGLIGGGKSPIKLEYPDEFWQGLGCIKSNLRTK